MPVLLLMLSLTAAEKNPHLEKGIAQLKGLVEEAALVSLKEALAWPGNTSKELATVHLYIGLAHAGRSETEKAIESFKTALELSSSLTLPEPASPQVRELWLKAGGRTAPSASDLKPTSGPTEPIVIVKPVEVQVETKPSFPRWPRVVGAVAMATGAATVGVGVFFGVQAQSSANRAIADTSASALTADWASARSNQSLANWLLVPGIAVLVLGATLLFISLVAG
jgi:hypothetical protein